MRALVFERSTPRFAAARVAGMVAPGRGAKVGPLSLDDVDPPALPGADWLRVRPRLAGICGSDLATVDAVSSRWFEPIVSFPFVPGHEIVGDLDGGGRVVVEPVLGCAARGVEPPCPACAAGRLGNCERIAHGHLRPGLQTGFCTDTGGGWGTELVAHRSQLHDVPADLDDEAAVMVEPAACATHAALAVPEAAGVVVVLGAGTIGLCAVAALRRFRPPATLLAVAKHPEQRALARDLGADVVVAPGELVRGVRRATGTMLVDGGSGDGRLAGGADAVVDCVGSASSVADALAVTRPRGIVVLAGMPGEIRVDLTPLWQREIDLRGAYAYGVEPAAGGRRTFELAFELVRSARLGRLVSATYRLDRYEEALAHAAEAGRRGAVKIAFDLRGERNR